MMQPPPLCEQQPLSQPISTRYPIWDGRRLWIIESQGQRASTPITQWKMTLSWMCVCVQMSVVGGEVDIDQLVSHTGGIILWLTQAHTHAKSHYEYCHWCWSFFCCCCLLCFLRGVCSRFKIKIEMNWNQPAIGYLFLNVGGSLLINSALSFTLSFFCSHNKSNR